MRLFGNNAATLQMLFDKFINRQQIAESLGTAWVHGPGVVPGNTPGNLEFIANWQKLHGGNAYFVYDATFYINMMQGGKRPERK